MGGAFAFPADDAGLVSFNDRPSRPPAFPARAR